MARLEQDPDIIFVIGGPGVGKGTQCTRLALEPELKIAHVSVGDLLRKEQASNSTEAELIKHHMLAGTLVPDELSVAILRKFLTAKMGEGFTRFLVDGFPRSARQVDMFETEICKCKAVFLFQASKEVMRERVKNRAVTSGRLDDTEEIFNRRLENFENENQAVLACFLTQGRVLFVNCNPPLSVCYGFLKNQVELLLRAWDTGRERDEKTRLERLLDVA